MEFWVFFTLLATLGKQSRPSGADQKSHLSLFLSRKMNIFPFLVSFFVVDLIPFLNIKLVQNIRQLTVNMYIFTISVEIYHPQSHQQWMPVELVIGIALPGKSSQMVTRPNSHQDHGHKPRNLNKKHL